MQAPSVSEVQAALERVLKSPSFQRVPRFRRFLQYVVDKTLAGQADEIKEYSLGVDVYFRGIRFDPCVDCIVRVDAINIRRRLARYYQNEGLDDTLVISIPKGGYVPTFETRLTAQPVFDLDVQEACWRAQQYLVVQTPESVRLAQQNFRKIIQTWPSSGIAHAGLAEAVLAALGLQELAPAEGNPLVVESAVRALQLDDTRVDVQIYSAVPGICDPSQEGVRSALGKILRTDPGHAIALYWAAGFCSSNGYHDEAVALMEKAIQAQPKASFFRTWTAGALFYAGRQKEARHRILEAVELSPSDFVAKFWLSQILIEDRHDGEALESAIDAVQLCSSSLALWGLGSIQARVGLREEAELTLETLQQRMSTQYVAHSGLAGILCGLGRLPEAWDELVKAKQAQESIMGWSRFDPRWEPLRRIMPCL